MGLFSKSKKPFTASVKHVSGLEIPEGTTCQVTLDNGTLSIKSDLASYELAVDRINSVSYERNIDVQRCNKSSALGGVIGAAAFGVSGAVIGSRPKMKEERMITGCLTVSYASQNGDNLYLLLEDAVPNSRAAAGLTDELEPLLTGKQKETVKL